MNGPEFLDRVRELWFVDDVELYMILKECVLEEGDGELCDEVREAIEFCRYCDSVDCVSVCRLLEDMVMEMVYPMSEFIRDGVEAGSYYGFYLENCVWGL